MGGRDVWALGLDCKVCKEVVGQIEVAWVLNAPGTAMGGRNERE